MKAAQSLAMLDGAADGRVQEKTRARLMDAAKVVGEPFLRVEAELARLAHVGAAPGTQAAAHLVSGGGKRVRPLSALLACACFGDITPAAEHLATAAELIHAATLLHDDVIDDGSERRGVPTARRIYGNAVSVLAGDLLLVHALELVSKTGQREALATLFSTLRTLVDGEVVQLRGRTTLDPTEETYIRIVTDKTASLFVWALTAGARAGGAAAADVASFAEFGVHLGVAFQLVDDVIDYASDPQVSGKKLCADLLEGKLTLPLIQTMKEDPSTITLVSRLRAGESELGPEIAGRVRSSSAIGESRARAEAETRLAAQALDGIRPSHARTLLLGVAAELAGRVS
jgi:octaprenyl-diphosphate synthase